MRRLVLAALGVALSTVAYAEPYRMTLESNDDRSSGAEVYALTFNSWADVINYSIGAQGYSALDINSAFGIAGLTYDGAYRMLLESNGDRSSGAEVYALTFNTWDDVINYSIGAQGYSALDINSAFSIAGLAYDGSYRMLLESNDDRSSGAEVYALTFNTWDDVINYSIGAQGYSALDINSAFSIAGFEFDGSYRVLLESNADRASGAEVYAVTFDTWDDLINYSIGAQGYSALDINSLFGIADFAFEFEPVSEVPEPAIFGIFGLGFAAVGAARIKRRIAIAN